PSSHVLLRSSLLLLCSRVHRDLHSFPTRRSSDLTHEASEVDEQTFFYSRETGGTVVSSALFEMQKIVRERYPVDQWNIYAAQARDRKSTRLNSSHVKISYAVFCLKKKNKE